MSRARIGLGATAIGLSLALFGCGSDGASGSGPSGPGGGGGGLGGADGAPCAVNENDSVRLSLAPACESCHGAGSSRPFFATLRAFEDLLAYDERYVVRGDPDASELVRMLEGRGEGAFVQMPLVGEPFAARAERGETAIDMAGIREWIRTLPPPDPTTAGPDPLATATRRLGADELIRAIQVALGQEPTGGVPPLLDAGGASPLAPDSPRGVDYTDGTRRQTYLMLGGPAYLQQRPPEPTFSPSSLLALTQIAQGACSNAVADRNPNLFVHATLDDGLPDGETAVRENIAHLYRRFLHERPTEEDVDALLDRVFAPAASTSVADGWTQVCTALVRDPLFITF